MEMMKGSYKNLLLVCIVLLAMSVFRYYSSGDHDDPCNKDRRVCFVCDKIFDSGLRGIRV